MSVLDIVQLISVRQGHHFISLVARQDTILLVFSILCCVNLAARQRNRLTSLAVCQRQH